MAHRTSCVSEQETYRSNSDFRIRWRLSPCSSSLSKGRQNVGLAASHRGVVIAFALLAACCVAQPGMAPDSRACSLRIHRRGIPPSPPVSPSCRENVLYSFENLGLSPQFCKYSKQSGPEKLARLHSHAHVLVDFLRGPKWQSGLMDHLRRRRGDDKSTGRRKRLDFACH